MRLPLFSLFNKTSKKPAKPIIYQVNLLLKKGEQGKLYVKLIKWLLSSGRFIVIVVELIVIAAFVFRYKLDAELSELQEDIKLQADYVQQLQADEKVIRRTQFQLSNIRQIRQNNTDFPGVLSNLSKITPSKIVLNNISFNSDPLSNKISVTINGQSPSNAELSTYLRNLQNEPGFDNIVLTNIAFEGQTVFTITGNLTQGGATN